MSTGAPPRADAAADDDADVEVVEVAECSGAGDAEPGRRALVVDEADEADEVEEDDDEAEEEGCCTDRADVGCDDAARRADGCRDALYASDSASKWRRALIERRRMSAPLS